MDKILSTLKKALRKPLACLSLVFVVLSALGFSGCSGQEKNLEGHWVDVNGSATLDFRGDTMTMREGQWSQTYRIKVEDIEGTTYIQNADQKEPYFYNIRDIKIDEDGALCAIEIVSDAQGHCYRFVREESLAKELEIQDLSKDLPKAISSAEIESFSLSFANQHGSYGLPSQWPSGDYQWKIARKGNTYKMDFRITGPSYIVLDFTDEVSAEYVAGLAKLIQQQGLPRLNGYYHKNNVDRPGYYLYVNYASNEMLRIKAEGEAANTCVFAIAPLLDYAAKQNLSLKDAY